MAETCYYKGTKVILLPGRNAHGKWECQFTIPDLRASAADTYEGRSPKECETEQEAETAAFECSKKILDSSNQSTTRARPGRVSPERIVSGAAGLEPDNNPTDDPGAWYSGA